MASGSVEAPFWAMSLVHQPWLRPWLGLKTRFGLGFRLDLDLDLDLGLRLGIALGSGSLWSGLCPQALGA
jgi:hypothetical protein